jgi:hypothetical protein
VASVGVPRTGIDWQRSRLEDFFIEVAESREEAIAYGDSTRPRVIDGVFLFGDVSTEQLSADACHKLQVALRACTALGLPRTWRPATSCR